MCMYIYTTTYSKSTTNPTVHVFIKQRAARSTWDPWIHGWVSPPDMRARMPSLDNSCAWIMMISDNVGIAMS